MPRVDVVIEHEIPDGPRVRQLEGMFDVPHTQNETLRWSGDVPIDPSDDDWSVGLIVGPSGSGKTTITHDLFGMPPPFKWGATSVIEDFAPLLPIDQIAEACASVGFNTIPSWRRPFQVLSTGERFRVEVARALLERPDPVVIDEFTSTVDRQVAKIGSHAIQKFVRKHNRKFVAVTCHHDVIEWLQPDWVLEMPKLSFARRDLQQRPDLNITIGPVSRGVWPLFAPFHYLTAKLPTASRCYGLWVDDELASFSAILYRPHPVARDIWGFSRTVTLPDYQGIGLSITLGNKLASCYKAIGYRTRKYPAHVAYMRTLDRSPDWKLVQKPGGSKRYKSSLWGGRPSAAFEYCGAPADREEAVKLMSFYHRARISA